MQRLHLFQSSLSRRTPHADMVSLILQQHRVSSGARYGPGSLAPARSRKPLPPNHKRLRRAAERTGSRTSNFCAAHLHPRNALPQPHGRQARLVHADSILSKAEEDEDQDSKAQRKPAVVQDVAVTGYVDDLSPRLGVVRRAPAEGVERLLCVDGDDVGFDGD